MSQIILSTIIVLLAVVTILTGPIWITCVIISSIAIIVITKGKPITSKVWGFGAMLVAALVILPSMDNSNLTKWFKGTAGGYLSPEQHAYNTSVTVGDSLGKEAEGKILAEMRRELNNPNLDSAAVLRITQQYNRQLQELQESMGAIGRTVTAGKPSVVGNASIPDLVKMPDRSSPDDRKVLWLGLLLTSVGVIIALVKTKSPNTTSNFVLYIGGSVAVIGLVMTLWDLSAINWAGIGNTAGTVGILGALMGILGIQSLTQTVAGGLLVFGVVVALIGWLMSTNKKRSGFVTLGALAAVIGLFLLVVPGATGLVGVPSPNISVSPSGLTVAQNYSGWVTVMDQPLSSDWTPWFDSKNYSKWRVWHDDGIEAEIYERGIETINLGYNFGPNAKVRFRGDGNITIKALPW